METLPLTDPRIKRLIFRSVHRGCKETDLVFGQYATQYLPTLNGPQLDIYERLLDEADADIWQWLTGARTPATEYAPFIDTMKYLGVPAE